VPRHFAEIGPVPHRDRSSSASRSVRGDQRAGAAVRGRVL